MRSQIGGPKAMPPVNLRRLAGDFHSVAKQASFNVAFGVDLEGFWEVFGGQNRGQNQFLGGFFSMFFSSAFRHRFLTVFGRLET